MIGRGTHGYKTRWKQTLYTFGKREFLQLVEQHAGERRVRSAMPTLARFAMNVLHAWVNKHPQLLASVTEEGRVELEPTP